MENYKIKVNNEAERNEIQELFISLGYNFVNNIACEKRFVVASQSSSGVNFDYWADVKEITLQYLRDLVVLKRNSIDDASLKDTFGDIWYVDSTNSYWMFENGVWCKAEEPLFKLEPIKKEGEVKMKEFLNPEQGYALVKCFVGETPIPESWIEVPEGAEIFLRDEYYSNDTTTQDKLKFIEKWLNGEKIQYILGLEPEKPQWHNFTECTMQYIKRPDIKFREAPKYVTINDIEFKNTESILNYIKSNFDLEDEE